MPAYPVNATKVLDELIGDIMMRIDTEQYLEPGLSASPAAESGWLVDKDTAVLRWEERTFIVSMQEVDPAMSECPSCEGPLEADGTHVSEFSPCVIGEEE